MTHRRPPVAQRPAPLQARVEALQQLRVELRRGQLAEGGIDVDPNQVLVSVTRGVFEFGDLKPLAHRLANRDPRLRVAVLIHLGLQPRQGDLGRGIRGMRLT